MKIISQAYFDAMKRFREDNNLQNELTDNDCICYANMFAVYADITNNRFGFEEMIETYDFVTDVIDGSRPDIMIMTDKYRDIYRLLKGYPLTENLDDETKKQLAFLIYQAKCIIVMDEETMKPTWNMGLFEKGTDYFLDYYEDEIEEFPFKYEIKQSLSNTAKDDYGLTIDNPIEVTSVRTEYNYLSLLVTDEGKQISFERKGTALHSDGNTLIDIWNIYTKRLLGKQRIATLYISIYGSEDALKAPKGFRFVNDNGIEDTQ